MLRRKGESHAFDRLDLTAPPCLPMCRAPITPRNPHPCSSCTASKVPAMQYMLHLTRKSHMPALPQGGQLGTPRRRVARGWGLEV